jgi:hypothetical protein
VPAPEKESEARGRTFIWLFGEFLFNFISKGFLERFDFQGFLLATGEIKSQTFINEDFFIAGCRSRA